MLLKSVFILFLFCHLNITEAAQRQRIIKRIPIQNPANKTFLDTCVDAPNTLYEHQSVGSCSGTSCNIACIDNFQSSFNIVVNCVNGQWSQPTGDCYMAHTDTVCGYAYYKKTRNYCSTLTLQGANRYSDGQSIEANSNAFAPPESTSNVEKEPYSTDFKDMKTYCSNYCKYRGGGFTVTTENLQPCYKSTLTSGGQHGWAKYTYKCD